MKPIDTCWCWFSAANDPSASQFAFTIALWPLRRRPNFTSTYRELMPIWHCVLNVKALVGDFNQEKALLGAFSVITNSGWNLVSSSIAGPGSPVLSSSRGRGGDGGRGTVGFATTGKYIWWRIKRKAALLASCPGNGVEDDKCHEQLRKVGRQRREGSFLRHWPWLELNEALIGQEASYFELSLRKPVNSKPGPSQQLSWYQQ